MVAVTIALVVGFVLGYIYAKWDDPDADAPEVVAVG